MPNGQNEVVTFTKGGQNYTVTVPKGLSDADAYDWAVKNKPKFAAANLPRPKTAAPKPAAAPPELTTETWGRPRWERPPGPTRTMTQQREFGRVTAPIAQGVFPALGAGIGAEFGPEGSWLGRMAGSALGSAIGSTAGQAAVPGEVTLKQTAKDVAEYGIAPEVAGKVGGKAIEMAGGLTKNLISRMMGVGVKDVMYGKDPARAILKYKLTGGSQEELLSQVEAKMNQVGKEIGTEIGKSPKPVNITSAINDPIQQAQQDILKSTMNPEQKQAAVKELNGLRESLTYEHALDPQGNIILGRPRKFKTQTTVTASDALEMKRLVGDNVNWQSSAFPDMMKSVQQRIYGNLRQVIEGAAPGAKALNQDYADLAGARQALIRATRRETAGKGTGIGFRDVMAGGMGEIFGGTPGAAAAVMTKRAVESPGGATRLGKFIQTLAGRDPIENIPRFLKTVLAAGGAGQDAADAVPGGP